MPNPELIRIVDGIARDKAIEREQVYTDIEQAVASGLRKHFNTEDTTEFGVTLDRTTGDISVARQGQVLPLSVMGRIGAQTVKQVMIQLIRQDERGAIYDEYQSKVGQIVTGTVARFEGPTMIVNLGRPEGIMPRSEQIPGEQHQVGERIQALIMEVRDTPSAIKIILSRSHPELIRRLFEREVPEVGERTIEIKALAREPGHRTKIAVSSIDTKVDAVGACVGVRGSRIKNIVEELGGEKIDIVRWNESSQILISNALKPAEVTEVSLCFELGRATVVVNDDQLSLAIGKRGQNVRLAARLTGWDVDILTPKEFQEGTARLHATLKTIEGVTQDMVDKIIAMGLIDVRDVEEVGAEPLKEELQLEEELAVMVVERCGEEAKLVTIEQEAKKAADARARASGASFFGNAPAVEAAAGERGIDGLATAATSPAESVEAATEEPAGESDRMPGANEATEGASPEVVVHDMSSTTPEDAPSPEEAAMQGMPKHSPAGPVLTDENEDRAALAQGREPPSAE
ncbi:transcription termination factor NusA [Humisphaera borealis]|uniref:Transcription termination/antitermination protein NusA n=1 Tax=Humisphaera borealis TaxID=2807512 RepID=A0A7M2WZM6_9BACT|nr:transcription termination factor NusA [Humisphaera borealis]QOV90824.1 transcription termination/antitermination protein NusA [Humisphaera borealis]